MATYNFKNVGKLKQKAEEQKLSVTPPIIGIKTPLEINPSSGGEIFVTYTDVLSTIKDNFRNLLLTNWGERLGHFNFGANLRPLLTDFVSQNDFDSEAIERIRSATERWMPFVSLEEFSSSINRYNQNEQISKVRISITYTVPNISDEINSINVELSVI